jgi:hypothetical protein
MKNNCKEFCADTFIWDDHCGFEMTPDAPIGPLLEPWRELVSSVVEIDKAQAKGRAAATFDIEGMNALNGRLDLVQTYYELGVRHMLTTAEISVTSKSRHVLEVEE